MAGRSTRSPAARATVDDVRISGLIVAIVVLAAASALGLALRARAGRFRATTPATAPAGEPAGEPAVAEPAAPVSENTALLASLGVIAGTPLTLVQFSTAFCAPCRATRVLCADVAEQVPGVRHIEVDAESHLDAVRALDVWRTPTVLLVDAAGQVRGRASGAPNRAQLLAAVAEIIPVADLTV